MEIDEGKVRALEKYLDEMRPTDELPAGRTRDAYMGALAAIETLGLEWMQTEGGHVIMDRIEEERGRAHDFEVTLAKAQAKERDRMVADLANRADELQGRISELTIELADARIEAGTNALRVDRAESERDRAVAERDRARDELERAKIGKAEAEAKAEAAERMANVWHERVESLEAIREADEMLRTGSGQSYATGHELIEAALNDD